MRGGERVKYPIFDQDFLASNNLENYSNKSGQPYSSPLSPLQEREA